MIGLLAGFLETPELDDLYCVKWILEGTVQLSVSTYIQSEIYNIYRSLSNTLTSRTECIVFIADGWWHLGKDPKVKLS